ncbi:MAG: hypothetical protein CL943_02690 [Candidatus Diapherotrites archaeon]|uniref:Translation elongation factor EFTu-like domain-containing protein n=1 Tax=Candidatus Iainarchaeum sp. TaxID=3101447 RepID=A0A2D6M191_9ARCH|nr:hypothetical protein [Candidatus Diapherotrites archaeon]|tara:strand:- start:1190 stop:1576 length:387 start_codon:yes stop_codon:yes gene_type:complete
MGFLNIFGKSDEQKAKEERERIAKKLSHGKETPAIQNQSNEPLEAGGVFGVKGSYSIIGVGLVSVGIVESGVLRPNQTAVVNGKIAVIKSIEANRQQIPVAKVGQNVGISLKGMSKDDVQNGLQIHFR